jgi:hypothetical protein
MEMVAEWPVCISLGRLSHEERFQRGGVAMEKSHETGWLSPVSWHGFSDQQIRLISSASVSPSTVIPLG